MIFIKYTIYLKEFVNFVLRNQFSTQMKKLFLIPILFFAFTACNTDPNTPTTDDDSLQETEIVKLRNKVEQFQMEKNRSDSTLNEMISFFNEVQNNLARISVKEDEILVRSSNPELNKDDQEWILQEIQNINFLRTENAKTVGRLRKELSNKDLKITELNTMVDRLVNQIKSKDEQINALQTQLADVNMEYSKLFDDYQEQVELAYDVMKEMNTVYFAYGTMKELTANNVLVRKGGFIGIGKEVKVAGDLNEKYFQQLDKTKVKQLRVLGKNPELVTDHPISSYKWDGDKLIILDADKFWRVSNYLVVEVK